MILNFSDAHWNMTKIVCTFKSETKSFQWYLLHLLHEHIAAASSCHKFHNCDFAEWQKFRSFFSDQIQYLHMQFYHFRRIWALKRVSERMWVVGTYFSNDNVVDADDNDMWSISTLLIYIPLIWDEKQFPLKYSTISYDNDLLSIPHSSSCHYLKVEKNIITTHWIDPILFD